MTRDRAFQPILRLVALALVSSGFAVGLATAPPAAAAEDPCAVEVAAYDAALGERIEADGRAQAALNDAVQAGAHAMEAQLKEAEALTNVTLTAGYVEDARAALVPFERAITGAKHHVRLAKAKLVKAKAVKARTKTAKVKKAARVKRATKALVKARSAQARATKAAAGPRRVLAGNVAQASAYKVAYARLAAERKVADQASALADAALAAARADQNLYLGAYFAADAALTQCRTMHPV
ncbi:hypothetical protein [Nocardioides lijunqiniae]|uniref:hypothetical protein n=1 Tax=Nocardioides lijunqiniae TaxID=2760832 RepID=UPI001878825E|nr:hypothetical protein [Nocardioides lijunqiniae]